MKIRIMKVSLAFMLKVLQKQHPLGTDLMGENLNNRSVGASTQAGRTNLHGILSDPFRRLAPSRTPPRYLYIELVNLSIGILAYQFIIKS